MRFSLGGPGLGRGLFDPRSVLSNGVKTEEEEVEVKEEEREIEEPPSPTKRELSEEERKVCYYVV